MNAPEQSEVWLPFLYSPEVHAFPFKTILLPVLIWKLTNLSGITRQCCSPTTASAHNRIDKIFVSALPPTWPTCKSELELSTDFNFNTKNKDLNTEITPDWMVGGLLYVYKVPAKSQNYWKWSILRISKPCTKLNPRAELLTK